MYRLYIRTTIGKSRQKRTGRRYSRRRECKNAMCNFLLGCLHNCGCKLKWPNEETRHLNVIKLFRWLFFCQWPCRAPFHCHGYQFTLFGFVRQHLNKMGKIPQSKRSKDKGGKLIIQTIQFLNWLLKTLLKLFFFGDFLRNSSKLNVVKFRRKSYLTLFWHSLFNFSNHPSTFLGSSSPAACNLSFSLAHDWPASVWLIGSINCHQHWNSINPNYDMCSPVLPKSNI